MQFYYRRFEQQFGPMAWGDLVDQARSGMLYPTDLIWSEGWPNWQEARLVPGLFEQTPAQPSYQPASAAQPYSPSAASQPIGDDPMMRMLLPVGRSPWALIAGYLGIFSLLLIPAPFAIATGILALRDIKKNPHSHGKGRAIFAIVMGTLGTIVLGMVLLAQVL